jgi:hypothetical protein
MSVVRRQHHTRFDIEQIRVVHPGGLPGISAQAVVCRPTRAHRKVVSTHLGEVEQQRLDCRQHLHAALYDLAPSVSKGDVVDAGHLEAQFRQQLVRYLLLCCYVREVGVGILGLKSMIWEIFEFLRDDPLDLGVVLCM